MVKVLKDTVTPILKTLLKTLLKKSIKKALKKKGAKSAYLKPNWLLYFYSGCKRQPNSQYRIPNTEYRKLFLLILRSKNDEHSFSFQFRHQFWTSYFTKFFSKFQKQELSTFFEQD